MAREGVSQQHSPQGQQIFQYLTLYFIMKDNEKGRISQKFKPVVNRASHGCSSCVITHDSIIGLMFSCYDLEIYNKFIFKLVYWKWHLMIHPVSRGVMYSMFLQYLAHSYLKCPEHSDRTRDWARLAYECPGVSGGGVGQQWSALGLGALTTTILA